MVWTVGRIRGEERTKVKKAEEEVEGEEERESKGAQVDRKRRERDSISRGQSRRKCLRVTGSLPQAHRHNRTCQAT